MSTPGILLPEDGDHVVEATQWVCAGELDVFGLWPQFQLAGVALAASYLQGKCAKNDADFNTILYVFIAYVVINT